MSLQKDRMFNHGESEVSYYMGEVAAQGILVAYPTGAVQPPGLDDDANYAIVPTAATQKPVGILLDTVVNKDLTETELNRSKRERQINNKVEIVREGWFVTDRLASGITPSAGDTLYFTTGGLFTTATGSEVVGSFESEKNTDGYARIRLKIS